jgi:hypothetical protein
MSIFTVVTVPSQPAKRTVDSSRSPSLEPTNKEQFDFMNAYYKYVIVGQYLW